MPRKQQKRKPRRSYRKKTTALAAYAPIGKSLGFPKNNRVQMRYVTNVTLADSIGGIMQTQFYRANSIFDPDATGAGGQPLGRDQWTEFYNHYRVLKSKITVKFATVSQVANQSPSVCGMYLSDDTTVPSDYSALVESGRGKFKLSSNLNTETHSLTESYEQSKFFKEQGANQAQLGAAMGANPTEQAFFCLYSQSADLSAMMTQRNYLVQIDYLVELSEPKDLARS